MFFFVTIHIKQLNYYQLKKKQHEWSLDKVTTLKHKPIRKRSSYGHYNHKKKKIMQKKTKKNPLALHLLSWACAISILIFSILSDVSPLIYSGSNLADHNTVNNTRKKLSAISLTFIALI